MTQVTVFLVRHGETKNEVQKGPNKLRLHERLDPTLTEEGYWQSQQVFLALIHSICDQTPVLIDRGDSDEDGVIDPLRNMACFAAPMQACQGTAGMLSAAGMATQDKLTWRYTTVHTATAPSAIPIITCNELCRHVPEIQQCGGIETVLHAGLLHTAAAPWNDTRSKCPFMRVVVQEMKNSAQDFLKEWKADRDVYPPRRILDCQFLRLENADDPWSLEPITNKVNLCVNMLEPRKYLTPPRQGRISNKLQMDETIQQLEILPSVAVEDCVWRARQVGCDTVLFTVPSECIECILQKAAAPCTSKVFGPCTVVSFHALVNDTTGAIDWKWHGTFTQEEIQSNQTTSASATIVPEFAGMVDCLVPPPLGKDPSSVPANQWSKFPLPEPENIPPDYPDLPPFSMALHSPVPNNPPYPPDQMSAPGRGHASNLAGHYGNEGGRGGGSDGYPKERQTNGNTKRSPSSNVKVDTSSNQQRPNHVPQQSSKEDRLPMPKTSVNRPTAKSPKKERQQKTPTTIPDCVVTPPVTRLPKQSTSKKPNTSTKKKKNASTLS